MEEKPNTENRANSQSNIGIAVLCFCFMAMGWLGSFAWLKRADISDLLLQASQQKYLTMTGEAGPVTYLVQHTGYQELESFSLKHEDVLGVEVYELPDKAAIAFSRADTASINKVRNSPYVLTMKQQVIPMMCH